VNPNHLVLGTIADNNWDRERKGRTARGEKNGRAKVTDNQVMEMRIQFQSGDQTVKELAQKYKLSQRHVKDLVDGKYRNLPLAE